jgi:hypothetical protein
MIKIKEEKGPIKRIYSFIELKIGDTFVLKGVLESPIYQKIDNSTYYNIATGEIFKGSSSCVAIFEIVHVIITFKRV